MPPRQQRPTSTRGGLWDFFVVCLVLIVFRLIFHPLTVVESVYFVSDYPVSSAKTPSGQSSRTTSTPGYLMPVRGNEELVSRNIGKGNFQDFNVVGSLTKIFDHPRRFLRARYVNDARVLSENVTAPVFGRAAEGLMDTETADLGRWLMRDTEGICDRAISGIRYNIASLTLQHLRCTLTGSSRQHPIIEAAGGDANFKDGRCSPENVEKRETLLKSLWGLGESVEPACDEVQTTILNNLGTLDRFLQALISTTTGVVSELKSLLDVFASLLRADGDINAQSEQLVQHLLRNSSISGARLEVLASKAATQDPGDLDPFTALILHRILGSTLLSSRAEVFAHPPQFMVDAAKAGQVLPIRDLLRLELDRQAQTFNETSDLLSSPILPGLREWLSLIREANKADIFTASEKGDDERIRRYEKDNPVGREIMACMREGRLFWAEADSADRRIREVDDGAEYLEFLIDYLAQLQSEVPGMLSRLDDWDADVTKLAEELILVISSGRRYTAQERKQSQSDGDGRKTALDITRYQVHPQNLKSIRLGLAKTLRALEDAKAQVEDYNPQNPWDNWFETQMDTSRGSWEWGGLWAGWEMSTPKKPRKPRKPARPERSAWPEWPAWPRWPEWHERHEWHAWPEWHERHVWPARPRFWE